MLKKKFKKTLLLFLIYISVLLPCVADTMVTVSPKTLISTSDKSLNEGDYVNFIVNNDIFVGGKLVIKKGENVEGLVLEMVPNGWSSTPAKITIGQLETKDVTGKRVKLVGSIYKSGKAHDIASAIVSDWQIRGGEVQIKPSEDLFNLVYAVKPDNIVREIPVSITPNQVISTSHDEVEIGDELNFKVVKDTYFNNSLLFKEGSPALALVDYVSENGFVADSAYIQILKFKILDTKNNWVTVDCSMKIKGLECRDTKRNILKKCVHGIAFIIRGDEVELQPEQRNFNIFIEK